MCYSYYILAGYVCACSVHMYISYSYIYTDISMYIIYMCECVSVRHVHRCVDNNILCKCILHYLF